MASVRSFGGSGPLGLDGVSEIERGYGYVDDIYDSVVVNVCCQVPGRTGRRGVEGECYCCHIDDVDHPVIVEVYALVYGELSVHACGMELAVVFVCPGAGEVVLRSGRGEGEGGRGLEHVR